MIPVRRNPRAVSILDRIVRHKKREIALEKMKLSPERMRLSARRSPRRRHRFARALRRAAPVAVIAEIKRRSPSKGLLTRAFDAQAVAKAYEKGGAVAISVLTDRKFFGGGADIFRKVRAVTRLPLLRKDFIVDEYQIHESRCLGADAVLLIASVLSASELARLSRLARSHGLDILFEVHSREELAKVIPLKPRLLGVNNRDLKTFRVDLCTTARTMRLVPRDTLVVSESGIRGAADLLYLKKLGVRAALVGERLMRMKNPSEAVRRLLGKGGCVG